MCADCDSIFAIGECDRKQVRRSLTGLLFPGLAAVGSRDDRTKRADSPTEQWILRRKSHCEEMIANAGLTQYPSAAGVCRRQNDAARACDHDTRTIFDVEAVERCVRRVKLLLPLKSAVVGREHDAIRADRPTALLVRRKSDCVDGISLRKRVLPLPAAKWILGVGY